MKPALRRMVKQSIESVPDVLEGESVFDPGEKAYFVDGRQMAGIGPDHVGIRLTRQVIAPMRRELRADPRVDVRYAGSDWIEVKVSAESDVDFVKHLVELAASHYRVEGRALRPPPTGSELERRRRFH